MSAAPSLFSQQVWERAQAWVAVLNSKVSASQSYQFVLEPNFRAKYHKVVQSWPDTSGKSVHAFMDGAGLVYKAESWAKPAKPARYDLDNEQSYAALLKDAGVYGSYLYSGQQSYQLPKAA